MEQMHVQPTDTGSGLSHNAASEEQLWSYLVQLASVLRAIHRAGLACRAASLAPSKARHVPTSAFQCFVQCAAIRICSASWGSHDVTRSISLAFALTGEQAWKSLGRLCVL